MLIIFLGVRMDSMCPISTEGKNFFYISFPDLILF